MKIALFFLVVWPILAFVGFGLLTDPEGVWIGIRMLAIGITAVVFVAGIVYYTVRALWRGVCQYWPF